MVHNNPTISILELGGWPGNVASTFFGDDRSNKFADTRFLRYVYAAKKNDLEKLLSLVSSTPQVSHQEINICTDLDEENLKPESFDVVIASFSMAAITDSKKALINMKSLLKPGGKLCLLEVTNPSLRNLALGSICNWWM